MSPEPELGLRERKRVRTRSAIQHHALRLFSERGYEATTVSQIAEAAEVSESTFFRYFTTKEAVILEDDFDEEILASFRAQPAGLTPIGAFRAALRETFADITAAELADASGRADLMFKVPDLRQAVAGRMVQTLDQVAEVIAARIRRPATDLLVRAQAGAVIGALMAVAFSTWQQGRTDWVEQMDRALAQLEEGFRS